MHGVLFIETKCPIKQAGMEEGRSAQTKNREGGSSYKNVCLHTIISTIKGFLSFHEQVLLENWMLHVLGT